MIDAARLRKYAIDLWSFPMDAAVAWRSAGPKGVWGEVRRRTVDRLGGYAVRFLVETDLSRLEDIQTPGGVAIREFTGPDWSGVEQLVQRAGSQQAEALASGRHCLVAWRGEQAIGCVWFSEQMEYRHESYDLPLPSDAVYVWQVGVFPGERRRGVAAALLAAGLRQAMARGRRRSWAIIHPKNQGSLLTFAKVGPSRVVGTVARVKVLSWMRNLYRRRLEPLPIESVIPGPRIFTEGSLA